MSNTYRVTLTLAQIDRLIKLTGNNVDPELNKLFLDKIDAMVNRSLYTAYKTSGDEIFRQKYLDNKDIPKDFRW